MSERYIRYHQRSDVTQYGVGGVLEIQCYSCKEFRPWYDRMYRCFDCGVWLCGNCVPDHFSNRHEPHPLHLHEWQSKVAMLERDLGTESKGFEGAKAEGDSQE